MQFALDQSLSLVETHLRSLLDKLKACDTIDFKDYLDFIVSTLDLVSNRFSQLKADQYVQDLRDLLEYAKQNSNPMGDICLKGDSQILVKAYLQSIRQYERLLFKVQGIENDYQKKVDSIMQRKEIQDKVIQEQISRLKTQNSTPLSARSTFSSSQKSLSKFEQPDENLKVHQYYQQRESEYLKMIDQNQKEVLRLRSMVTLSTNAS